MILMPNGATSWLKSHYSRLFRIDEIACVARMSSSALYHNFKAVTAMSALQYQKHDARAGHGSAIASYQVGYESPSQFSREYKFAEITISKITV